MEVRAESRHVIRGEKHAKDAKRTPRRTMQVGGTTIGIYMEVRAEHGLPLAVETRQVEVLV
jgi:hypothetical protein